MGMLNGTARGAPFPDFELRCPAHIGLTNDLNKCLQNEFLSVFASNPVRART